MKTYFFIIPNIYFTEVLSAVKCKNMFTSATNDLFLLLINLSIIKVQTFPKWVLWHPGVPYFWDFLQDLFIFIVFTILVTYSKHIKTRRLH